MQVRKFFTATALALSMGACANAPAVIQNIFDQVNAVAKVICQETFVFSTIDAMIKAIGGPPVAETIASILCTQARALKAQQAPKAAMSSEGPATILGTVIINGKPVTIAVQR